MRVPADALRGAPPSTSVAATFAGPSARANKILLVGTHPASHPSAEHDRKSP